MQDTPSGVTPADPPTVDETHDAAMQALDAAIDSALRLAAVAHRAAYGPLDGYGHDSKLGEFTRRAERIRTGIE